MAGDALGKNVHVCYCLPPVSINMYETAFRFNNSQGHYIGGLFGGT